jgi:mannose-6-phosphate isomerase-like protein (cupin superfamily)/DNA-binding XRE family transcriptional regulator
MQETIREIASRVREMRALCEFSPEDMAGHLTLSREEYLRYENAEEDIPASVLYNIAQKLGMDMSTLLTGENPRVNIFAVTRKGRGVVVERRKDYGYQNIAAQFSHKKGEFFIVSVDPKNAGEPHLNAHPGQEFNYVLEGRMKLYIHKNEIVLEPGDSVYFDSTHPHAMEAMDGQPAKFLAVIL